jgi:alpha-tubulin suppressor-like RCC1 family protein
MNLWPFYGWGYNRNGQIGIGRYDIFQLVLIEVEGFGKKKIVMISCGYKHSMALDDRGRVFSWEFNQRGQLGNGNFDDSFEPKIIKKFKNILISKISCGEHHSLFLT